MKWLNTAAEILLALLISIYYFFERWVLFCVPVAWRAKDISNDIVLITGGGSGIGRLMAKGFAKLGCTVVVWDVNSEGNQETVSQIKSAGGKAQAFKCDVTKREEVYEVAEKVKKEVGEVTILVNNAGIVSGKDFMDIPDHMVEKTFQVNVLAHFWTTKAFLPDMLKKNHGHIVTIASIGGHIGVNKLVDYCSSKFAAVGFDESLRVEMIARGMDGIFTTCVCPFFINTGMFDGVKSNVIPILEPEYVAKQVIDAVLVNEEVLILPRYLVFLLVLKAIFPSKSTKVAGEAIGFFEMMSRFSGRQPKSDANSNSDIPNIKTIGSH